MTYRFALIVLGLCLSGLTACASGPERKIDYRAAAPPPPLEVPPDLVKPADDPSLSVPAAAASSATFSGYAERLQQPRPGTGAVLPVPENVQVARAGSQRWLVVHAEPERLWPVVREFFPRQGLTVAKENSITGVIETDWAENRANIPDDMIRRFLGKIFDNLYSSGTRDKFRLRLERGATPGTTEIYLSHRGLMEVVEETRSGTIHTRWQARPSDPELEAEMLALLMTDLGVEAKRAKSRVSEARSPAGAKIEGDDRPVLKVYDRRDNTWRRIGLALDRAGWTLIERDRGRRYAVAAPAPDRPHDRQADKPPARYEIVLTEEGSITTVQVRPLGPGDKQGGSRILSMLYEQLK